MSVVRHDKNEYFYIELFDPNGQACNSESHDGVHGLSVPTNQWVNLIWRYNAEKKVNELRINDNIDSLTCSAIHDMVDEKFINNAIGGSVDGKGTAFQGEVLAVCF